MADVLAFKLTTNLAQVERAWRECPAVLRRALMETMDEQNQYTIGEIVRKRMSQRGEDTLGVVTSRLRSSVRASRARMAGGKLDSVIGTNVRYAGVHEYGFAGTVQVKAHTRRQFKNGRVQATKLIFDMETGRIRQGKTSNRKARLLVGAVQVKAHKRKMNMPKRAPIKRGIESRSARYTDAIDATITRVLKNLKT